MSKKKKFYVVWVGSKPGIYYDWEACKEQVSGFDGARYKSFDTEKDAKIALDVGPEAYKKDKESKLIFYNRQYDPENGPETPSISVDAACSGNPGPMEYRGVYTEDGLEFFRVGPYEEGTVNIGEFLAVVHALALFKDDNRNLPIYSDSRTAIKWISTGKANTKLIPTDKNKKIFQLIRRAEKWLSENPVNKRILKWETKSWGEIPADFGRK